MRKGGSRVALVDCSACGPSSGVKYKDFGDGDYTTTVIVRKHRTQIKIVQYNGEGWG